MVSTIGGDERIFDWVVPVGFTGQVQMRITRDGFTSMCEDVFNIAPLPQGLEVTQACPEYIQLRWDLLDNATSYKVFSLGEKYMEEIGQTTEDVFMSNTLTT